jgi:hypothetical protein
MVLCSPVYAQNDLTKYAGHYPSEKVNGRSLLDVIQKSFISTFGNERWRRLVSYGTESPIQAASNDAFGRLLTVHVCKPHNCGAEYMDLVMHSETGKFLVLCSYGEARNAREIEWAGEGWSLKAHSRLVSESEKEAMKARGAKYAAFACDDGSWETVLTDMFGTK